MEKEQIIQILLQNNCPEVQVDAMANKILCFKPQILASFEQWTYDGAFPELEMEGYTIKLLCDDYGLHPIGAFVTLDWLSREPDKATAALRRGKR